MLCPGLLPPVPLLRYIRGCLFLVSRAPYTYISQFSDRCEEARHFGVPERSSGGFPHTITHFHKPCVAAPAPIALDDKVTNVIGQEHRADLLARESTVAHRGE